MPNSQVSNKSKQSNKSKNVAKQPENDDTLYGSAKNHKNPQKDPALQKIKEQVKAGDYSHPDLVIIPESELIRMKNNAIITTKEEQLQQKRILEEQKEKQQAAAKAKKQKMLQLEEEKKKQVPLSEIQKEEKVVKDSLLNRAQEILNEQLDDVKHMNKMMMYAKCVTVRDQQLQEREVLHDHKKNEEKRKDLMMEIERLKQIKFYEELEKYKKEEQRSGHLVIIDQIKERELKRLREKEDQEKEGQQILKEIKQLQKEETENIMKKKVSQKKELDQIFDANQNAQLIKQKRIIQEKEEEDNIVKYNLEKAQKEAEYIAEQKRIKDEKEREVQRLRELQEKAYDRQAELDALRAKRAMEQSERLAREKEKREAEWKAKINQELYEARKLQSLEKQKRLEEQAKMERDEFQRIIQAQKQERDIELKLEKEKEDLLKNHAEELRKQIALNEELKKQSERDRLEEGKKIKDNLANHKKLLENIKSKKLDELKSNNIKEKYTSELARKKIVI